MTQVLGLCFMDEKRLATIAAFANEEATRHRRIIASLPRTSPCFSFARRGEDKARGRGIRRGQPGKESGEGGGTWSFRLVEWLQDTDSP